MIKSLEIHKKTNENKDIIILVNKANKRYLIFSCISLLLMIIMSYSIITFNEVYIGGIDDLIF